MTVNRDSVVFLKSVRVLEEDLGFIQVSPTIIYEDNNGCITLKNPHKDDGGLRYFYHNWMNSYFTTVGKKIVENCICVLPNSMND